LSNNEEIEKAGTIRVSLEVPPPLTLVFGVETSRWHIIRREVAGGTLLGDLLTIFAVSYPEFRKGVFDPIRRELNSGLSITLNGVLLDANRKMTTELLDGDRVTLVPDHLDEQHTPEYKSPDS
jgi:molybdopterin converting factor small subunit